MSTEIFWAEWDSLHFLSQGFILNIDILEQCLENCTETNLLWKFIENLYLYKILTSSSSLQCSAWASVDLKELTPFHHSLSSLLSRRTGFQSFFSSSPSWFPSYVLCNCCSLVCGITFPQTFTWPVPTECVITSSGSLPSAAQCCPVDIVREKMWVIRVILNFLVSRLQKS